MKRAIPLLCTLLLHLICLQVSVEAEEQNFTVRVLGLSNPERENDLRGCMKFVPGVQIVSLNFPKNEATLRCDVPNSNGPIKAETIVRRINDKLAQFAQGTISTFAYVFKLPSEIPEEKLHLVKIDILLPDCIGCRVGAYEAISGLDGVERASVEKDAGAPCRATITAALDPAKAKREALLEALQRARVQFPQK